MIQYRKVLELYFNGSSLRTISTMVGSSRNTIKSIIDRAEVLGWTELKKEMTDYSLEEMLFPEKTPTVKGYFNEDWEYIHKELLKKNMTLKLLHTEYEQRARTAHKIPYAYRTYCEHYGTNAAKHKLTMPVKRKPGEIMEVDWAKCKALHFAQSTSTVTLM